MSVSVGRCSRSYSRGRDRGRGQGRGPGGVDKGGGGGKAGGHATTGHAWGRRVFALSSVAVAVAVAEAIRAKAILAKAVLLWRELVLLCYATAAMTQRRTLRSRLHGLRPQARLSVAKSHQVFLPGLVYEPRVHTGGYKDISLLHRCMPNVPRERGADS
jgi:hypothetical protein